MGIWENLGMGGYRGFSRPAARLLQQAVQLAGDLGCEQADTSHLLLAMLQQQGAAAQFLTRKNITEPEVRRQLAQQRSGPAPHHGLCAHWGAERPRQPGRAGASSLRHAGR
mgnify:CR=1 FL=1